jgi:TatD DNase family protein
MNPQYYDCHTHVNFVAFKDDAEETLVRAQDAGVGMIMVGTQYDTSADAVKVAESHENVYAAIGLHPIHSTRSYHDEKELGEGGKEFTSRGEAFDAVRYEALAQSPKVVAIGECGLDYYRLEEDTKKTQEETFIQQIEMANRLNKPLMLHIRNAYEDSLALLRAHAKVKGDVHFFAGDWNIAKQFLDFGFTLSFTGVLTFARDYDETVRNAPLDMLLTETDAPYVAPKPYRGKRNEPAYVVEVVKVIAEIRGEPLEKVQEQLASNARRVFGLK